MAISLADAELRLARQSRRHDSSAPHVAKPERRIASWADFYASLGNGPYLTRLDDYPGALLVAGSDPAATTALARLFKRAPAFAHAASRHDELDGALALAGLTQLRAAPGRHCFDTSHLRERYGEYFGHERFTLVWVLREPRAAVSSLLDPRARLPLGDGGTRFGGAVRSRLEKACARYLATVRHTAEIKARLGHRVAIVDYDELAEHRDRLLPALCEFAGVSFDEQLLRHLHGKSVRKRKLASWEDMVVDQLALPAYRRAYAAATLGTRHG